MSAYGFNYARFQEPEWADWKPTREECYADIKKIAEKFAPLIEADFTQMFRKYRSDAAALTGNKKFTFAEILDEVIAEAAYEAISKFIPEDGE